ncbi:kinase-like protein [Suhomyces tanzawaensis NRRL Y-17324]|uniref:EKC/KEOPS complex subunit BUD32 n=1 Tax=Suhomyces tanzawaensis NRRL Y-17324 TaxID=984487 RepID=A0A1E4SGS8_9ASCO|nr:kinase-like protein [Suhomyces tanzawaensis NRRL Y-17324]ODV78708.1 kinase-like protein [Suhomyces tanzawaensis NRRL Y-17324]
MTDHIIQQVQVHLPNIPLEVVSQGAEALVFQTSVHPYYSKPCLPHQDKFIIKFRPRKPYRHPKIDAAITKNRTIGEVKFMAKLTKLGIKAPSVILADFPNGIIWMEYLGKKLPNGDVSSLKNWLWYYEKVLADESLCLGSEVQQACINVGLLIGKLHLNDMIHGDLTSSNILLEDSEPVLIDFGLSSYSGMAEDKAVDLYVLERAMLSTHSKYSDHYVKWLLQGYEQIHGSKEFRSGGKKLVETLRKLDEVRLRGRKRSMLG